MRFVLYRAASVRGMKVDWDVQVDITEEVRRALHPQDPEDFRAGRLRRPFHHKPPRPGTRSASVAGEETVHPKGALVFATEDDSYVYVEAT